MLKSMLVLFVVLYGLYHYRLEYKQILDEWKDAHVVVHSYNCRNQINGAVATIEVSYKNRTWTCEEARRFVDNPQALVAMIRVVQHSLLYKVITLESWVTLGAVVVISCWVLYLFFQYLAKMHWINSIAIPAHIPVEPGGKKTT